MKSETVLGILRTYLFAHTTNRIDVELGARLFRHLLALPVSYFQARRVGDSEEQGNGAIHAARGLREMTVSSIGLQISAPSNASTGSVFVLSKVAQHLTKLIGPHCLLCVCSPRSLAQSGAGGKIARRMTRTILRANFAED